MIHFTPLDHQRLRYDPERLLRLGPVTEVPGQPLDPALGWFQRIRHELHHALIAWLSTKTSADDIALKVNGTIAALRQIAELLATGPQ
jgi:hypothetical protein